MNNDSNNKKVAEELPEYKLFKDHFKQLSSEIDKWDASQSDTFIEKCKTLLIYAENQMQIQMYKEQQEQIKNQELFLDTICRNLFGKSLDVIVDEWDKSAAEKS